MEAHVVNKIGQSNMCILFLGAEGHQGLLGGACNRGCFLSLSLVLATAWCISP